MIFDSYTDILDDIRKMMYATIMDADDRLHNFKVAAGLQDCLPTTALAGMMAKHTVSVHDMIRGLENGLCYPIELWNEKIGDSINYLLLLAAAVREVQTDRALSSYE